MKKLLLTAAAIGLILSACKTTPKYTITGTIADGEQTGTVYLLTFHERTADTIAKAPIIDGKFSITGTADSITNAYLVVSGNRNRFPIFLENLPFTASINIKNPGQTLIEGSETQKLMSQFAVIRRDGMQEQMPLHKEYQDADQAKDETKMKEIIAKFEAISAATAAKEDELLKANPDTYAAAYFLSSRMHSFKYDELVAKYELLGANAKATRMGKDIAQRIEKLAVVAVGQKAPDFTMNTPESQLLSLYDLKGKIKIIDFWASWCGPCRGENPHVVAIYKKYHPKGLEILGVSLDQDKEAWINAIKDDQLTWSHVSDLQLWNNAAAKLYCVSSIPHMLILDENNTIIAKDLRGDALEAKIAELLP